MDEDWIVVGILNVTVGTVTVPDCPTCPMVNPLNPEPNADRVIPKVPAAPFTPMVVEALCPPNCRAPVPVTEPAPPENVMVLAKIFKPLADAFNVPPSVTAEPDNVLFAVAPANETASL